VSLEPELKKAVILSAAKDLMASTAMRSFAALRMTGNTFIFS
jgi:hypothetical protein